MQKLLLFGFNVTWEARQSRVVNLRAKIEQIRGFNAWLSAQISVLGHVWEFLGPPERIRLVDFLNQTLRLFVLFWRSSAPTVSCFWVKRDPKFSKFSIIGVMFDFLANLEDVASCLVRVTFFALAHSNWKSSVNPDSGSILRKPEISPKAPVTVQSRVALRRWGVQVVTISKVEEERKIRHVDFDSFVVNHRPISSFVRAFVNLPSKNSPARAQLKISLIRSEYVFRRRSHRNAEIRIQLHSHFVQNWRFELACENVPKCEIFARRSFKAALSFAVFKLGKLFFLKSGEKVGLAVGVDLWDFGVV